MIMAKYGLLPDLETFQVLTALVMKPNNYLALHAGNLLLLLNLSGAFLALAAAGLALGKHARVQLAQLLALCAEQTIGSLLQGSTALQSQGHQGRLDSIQTQRCQLFGRREG